MYLICCFSGGSDGKESACQCKRRRAQSLGQEDPLEKGMAIHSSILAWRIVHEVAKSQTQLSNPASKREQRNQKTKNPREHFQLRKYCLAHSLAKHGHLDNKYLNCKYSLP